MKSHLLLGTVAMFAWASSSMAQEAQKEAVPLPEKVAKKPASQSFRQLAALLQEPMDMSDFMQQMTLKEFLTKLHERMFAQGKNLPIIVDMTAFKVDNPDAEDTYDTPVQFEKFPRQLPIRTALRLALSQVKTNDATYLIRQGHIEITTFSAADPDALLGERVTAHFDKRPLDEALDELSDLTGATIVVDTRVADKAKTPVTANFKGTISLESAVRLLAVLADLHAEVKESTLFVTAKAKEEAVPQKAELHLRKQRLDLGLSDLARWGGVTIVLDPRVKVEGGIHMGPRPRPDVAEGVANFGGFGMMGVGPAAPKPPPDPPKPILIRKKVTASFKPNVSPLAAVRIVANQVDLAVVALENAYYVTTLENADRLRDGRPPVKKEAGKDNKPK